MWPWGTFSSRTAWSTSRMMARPLLSSPPSTVVPSLRITSPSTTGVTPSPGATVSMCAESSIASAPSTLPSKWATRFPTSPPTAFPASSMKTTPPNASSISLRRNAMARSFRDRLSIRTNSSTRSLRRALSIKQYLLCPDGPFGCNAASSAAVDGMSDVAPRDHGLAGSLPKNRETGPFFLLIQLAESRPFRVAGRLKYCCEKRVM